MIILWKTWLVSVMLELLVTHQLRAVTALDYVSKELKKKKNKNTS